MIRSYNDHAANERTFLAWVRTGLSTVALGTVVEKGSLVALLFAGASPPALSGSGRDYFSDYGGSVLIGLGFAAMAGAAFRFVSTALLIDDHRLHSAGIVRAASALRRRKQHREIEGISTNVDSASPCARNEHSHRINRGNLELVGGTDVGQTR